MKTDGRFLNKERLTSDKIEKARALNELAKERGESLARMALKWVRKDDAVTSVLIGASRPEQILDNIKTVSYTHLDVYKRQSKELLDEMVKKGELTVEQGKMCIRDRVIIVADVSYTDRIKEKLKKMGVSYPYYDVYEILQ